MPTDMAPTSPGDPFSRGLGKEPGPRRIRFWENTRYGLALALALTAIAVPGLPATAAQDDSIDIAAVDRFVLDGLARAGIPGAAIAITRGTDVLHVRGYGHDSELTPVTEHTPFRIASLSKAFTSLAVMQLVEAGRLALDDPVYAHLPEFRIADPRGADITIRQLLDQTSGLADREVPDLSRRQPTTLADAATSLHSARLVADPGAEFNYHNPNYQVAARLVEVVSGESFDQYLRDHVLRPAGMSESVNTSIDNDQLAGLADGHVLVFGQPIAVPAPGDFADGAGGVVSTAADMAQWLILQAGGGITADGTRLVSESSMAEMHTSRGTAHYALGWGTRGPEGTTTRLEHTGNLLTFSAATAILPESGIGLTLMFNASSGLMLEQTAILQGALEIIEGGNPVTPDVSGRLLDSILAVLTFAVILLALRGVLSSRRWAARLAESPILAVARLAPLLGILVLLSRVPEFAGGLLGGRDFTWVTILYGWPALVVFAVATAFAATTTLGARTWQLGAVARRKAWAALGRTSAATAREEDVQPQHDDRADDGSDDAGGLQEATVRVAAEEEVSEEAADEGADDSEDDCQQDAHALLAGNDGAGEEPSDQAHDDEAEDGPEHDFSFGSVNAAGIRRTS